MAETRTLRERALSKCVARTEVIDVPELSDNGEPFPLKIQGFGGELRARLIGKILRTKDDQADAVVAIIGHWPEIILDCSLDPETDEHVFQEADLPLITGMSVPAQQRIAMKALELSRIGVDAETDAGKV